MHLVQSAKLYSMFIPVRPICSGGKLFTYPLRREAIQQPMIGTELDLLCNCTKNTICRAGMINPNPAIVKSRKAVLTCLEEYLIELSIASQPHYNALTVSKELCVF